MANFNFNKVILGGRLTADPEMKSTPSGISVCSFTVAVNRTIRTKPGDETADFFRCTAWRHTAEFIVRHFRKSSTICVVGSVHTRNWINQATGQKRSATEIVVDGAFFVDSMAEAPLAVRGLVSGAAAQANDETYAPEESCVPESENPSDELPF